MLDHQLPTDILKIQTILGNLFKRVLTLIEVSSYYDTTGYRIQIENKSLFCTMTFSSNVVKNVKVSQDCYVSSPPLTHLNLEALNLLQVVLFCVLLFVLILLREVAGHFI